jgi:hypothetical protein
MEILKWLFISILSIMLLVILAPISFVLQIIYRFKNKKYDFPYYFKSIAVGVDALGGSFIYGSKRHTISAITGYKSYNGDKYHAIQEKCIDWFFYDGHCKDEAIFEKLI